MMDATVGYLQPKLHVVKCRARLKSCLLPRAPAPYPNLGHYVSTKKNTCAHDIGHLPPFASEPSCMFLVDAKYKLGEGKASNVGKKENSHIELMN